MVLTIDIGNSNVVLGVFEGQDLRFISRVSTNRDKTSDEMAVVLSEILYLRHIQASSITGAILSSVVPSMNTLMCSAVELVIGKKPFVVSPGIRTGLNVRIDNPAQLGSDLLVDCVAAAALYPKPVIVVDMGTATTMSVVDKECNMIGGVIMPGVKTALNALIEKTAQLPQISIESPRKTIGTNTNDSMRSGIVLGNASMIDGMIARFEEELGSEAFVVCTGGLSEEISKHTRKKVHHNPNLLIQGLYILYKKNGLPE